MTESPVASGARIPLLAVMQTAAEEKLMQAGCFTLLLAPFGAIVFAALRQWEYAGLWVLLVASWIALNRWLIQRDEARLRELLQRAFASHRCPPPTLEPLPRHAHTVFELTFDSPAHQAEAERSGAIAAFKEIVQRRYAHRGNSRNPFNADLAIELKSRQAP